MPLCDAMQFQTSFQPLLRLAAQFARFHNFRLLRVGIGAGEPRQDRRTLGGAAVTATSNLDSILNGSGKSLKSSIILRRAA